MDLFGRKNKSLPINDVIFEILMRFAPADDVCSVLKSVIKAILKEMCCVLVKIDFPFDFGEQFVQMMMLPGNGEVSQRGEDVKQWFNAFAAVKDFPLVTIQRDHSIMTFLASNSWTLCNRRMMSINLMLVRVLGRPFGQGHPAESDRPKTRLDTPHSTRLIESFLNPEFCIGSEAPGLQLPVRAVVVGFWFA